MKNIFLITQNGIPSSNVGGSNKVIHLLIKYLNNSIYSTSYLSSDNVILDTKRYSDRESNSETKKSLSFAKRNIDKVLKGLLIYQKSIYYRKELFFNSNLQKVSPKIIHAHHPVSLALVKDNRSSKILTIHSKGSILNDIMSGNKLLSQKMKKYYRKLEIEGVLNADIITFPSRASRDMYIEDIGSKYFEDKEILVTYNGIDAKEISEINEFTRDEINHKFNIDIKKSKLLLNIADHVRLKNIDKLILGIKKLVIENKVDVKLINIGDGPLTEILKELISKNGLTQKIFFVGRLNNYEVIRILKTSDALVMPSDKIVFDLVNLEALACGVPLLLSKNGGNLEILEENKNGFFIERNTPEEIAEGIKNILLHQFKNKITLNGAFSISSMIESYSEIYERL